MSNRIFLKSGGLAGALAAVAAMAIPASAIAQDRQSGWNGQRSAPQSAQAERGSPRGDRGGDAGARRQWNGGNVQAPQRNWNGSRDGNQVQNRWQGRPAPQQGQASAPAYPQRGAAPIRNGADNRNVTLEQRQQWQRERQARNADRDNRDGRRNWQNNGWQNNERQRSDWQQRQGYNNSWQNNNRWGQRGNYRGWNNNWRNDNRYDWHSYRNSNRNVYRVGRYYSPYNGYSYRRVGIGYNLQPMFFGRSYWLSNPWSYRLPATNGSLRWVRYFDDVLLVDTYNGEVLDVIHDFFW